ncbi:hypothetical protein [Parasitella parasitica]|uniref:NADP-dependent oxidoreductase domain-containing protein n=1 Tax=Parasitella parasitica TaxID=35722 RepID=A0A0B7NW25_9FUNG|nr:hypothetical protein [Parasitella parasitica]
MCKEKTYLLLRNYHHKIKASMPVIKIHAAVHKSLENFDLEYFDLYLIHWPGTSKKQLSDPINEENRTNSYKALERLYREGKVKHIGISNYTEKHLRHLLSVCTVIPHVHQFELHPCLYQPEILDLCHKHGIQIQAYSSLGEGALINGEVKLDCLESIAQKLSTSKALVLLRWAVQCGWTVIPKSKTVSRIKENSQIFSLEIANYDMDLLNKIHTYEPHRFCWDPSNVF